ncbi:MAG: hypothetical protein ACRDPJ_04905 [Nocardioidaceae bacterium]
MPVLTLAMSVSACASPVLVGAMGGVPSGPEPAYSVPSGSALSTLSPDGAWQPDVNGVVLRVDVHEGYDRSEIVSFAQDGTVVRAAETNVYASVDDYTTWRIDQAGLQRVLRAFDELDVRVATPGTLGDGTVSPDNKTVTLWMGDRVLSASVPMHHSSVIQAERLWKLANRVIVPDWHGSHVVEAPRPWVPSLVGVRASGPKPRSPVPGAAMPCDVADAATRSSNVLCRWPLDRPVAVMGEEFCLEGDDARKVFAMLTPGRNSAHVYADDGHDVWDLHLNVHLPAYYLLSSPCATVQ